jgi:transposase
VEESMQFVLPLKDGESMASLCREFGISRASGYKVYERYKECRLEGLTDPARIPYRYAKGWLVGPPGFEPGTNGL